MNVKPCDKISCSSFYFARKPSFIIIYKMSPSPWSKTFYRNFDDWSKKSLKCFDFTNDCSYSWLSSNYNWEYYNEFILFESHPFYYHLPFSFYVPWVVTNQSDFNLPIFPDVLCYRVTESPMHTVFPYHMFLSWFLSHEYFHSFGDCILFFRFSFGFIPLKIVHFALSLYFFPNGDASFWQLH